MPYHPVVDRFPIPIPLSPWAAAVFAAVFACVALLTARRASHGLAALVLFQPFALARVIAGTTVTLPKAALLGVLLGLMAYAGNAARLRERPAVWLFAAFVAYALATAASMVDAGQRAPALHETLKMLEYAVLFAAAYLCYRIDPDGVPLVTAIAVAAIAVSLSALAQEALGAPSGLCVGATIVPRIAGVLEGPNQLAGYLEIAIATLGAWQLRRRTVLASLALALAACTLVLTFSRAGIAGAAIAAAVIVYAGRRAAWPALQPAMFGLVAGIAGAAAWAFASHNATVLRLTFDDESLCAGGVGNRNDLWPAAWRMWLSRPLFGVGAGNFELDLPAYGVLGVRTHANSWYLQSLAEGGIVLFTATIALLATIGAAFRTKLWSGSPWILAAASATAALAFHQIFDYLLFYPKVGGPWLALVGIGAAAVAAARQTASPRAYP